MTHYADLTPYEYFEREMLRVPTPVFNIGWLDDTHLFPTADPDPELIEKLARLCRRRVHLTRGSHICELCPLPTREEFLSDDFNDVTTPSGMSVSVGNGEIHVVGPSDTAYLAPTMIVHYVASHKYRPPRDFVDGVMLGEE